MSEKPEEGKRTPVKPKDLDFQKLADELTQAPEVVKGRAAPTEASEAKKVKAQPAAEGGEMASSGPEDKGGAAPGAPPADAPAPAEPRAPVFLAPREVPKHPGELRAESDRLLEKIVFRLCDRIEQLLARLDELPIYEQAKLAPQLFEMLAQAKDMSMVDHWTRKLEKAILEKAALLAQGRTGSHLRKLGGMASQVQKEQKIDSRTTEGRNRARGLGKVANMGDLPEDL